MASQAEPAAGMARKPRRWWKWTRRVLLGLFLIEVLAGLALWGYAACVNWYGGRALAAALAKVRERHLPTTQEEMLAALSVSQRPQAHYLKAAFALLVPTGEAFAALPMCGSQVGTHPEFGKPVRPDVAELSRKFADVQKDALPLLVQARERNEYLYPPPLSEFSQDLQPVRHSVKIWLDIAFAAQAEGDGDRAMECYANALWMNRTLDGQPAVVTGLVRTAVDWLCCQEIEGALSRCRASDKALARLQGMLQAEAEAMDLETFYRGDLALTVDLSSHIGLQLARMELDARQLRSRGGFTLGEAHFEPPSESWLRLDSAVGWAWLWMCPGAVEGTCAKEIEAALRELELASKPTPELARVVAAPDPSSMQDRLTAARFLLVGKGWAHVAAAGVAAERYRLKHGRWPGSLDVLGHELATDPLTGEPLKFRRDPEGITIYSIGPNLTDDAGRGRSEGEAYDDIAFRLLNPGARNRP
ncbi:MAG: hypothetical protein MUP47_03850 [Phycisphaerae bacterium]|nr:hypothetical protein [Phycisphaerae bacterium]